MATPQQVRRRGRFSLVLGAMIAAAFLTTAFVVAGASAWYLLKGRFTRHARVGFSMALGLITVLAPLQVGLGDWQGLNTFEHQPLKVAAMEGHWESRRGAPLILFAIPDEEAEENRFEVAIPKLSSYILTHEWDGLVPGLKDAPEELRPPVAVVFWAFRIMVGIGLLMIGIAAVSVFLRFRRRLYDTRWFLRLCVAATPLGFVAILDGWTTSEVGRQPWVV